LQTCAGTPQSICQLEPQSSPYEISNTITVGSGVTIQGDPSYSNSQMVLQRQRVFNGAPVNYGDGPQELLDITGSGVTLENLTVDGAYSYSLTNNGPTIQYVWQLEPATCVLDPAYACHAGQSNGGAPTVNTCDIFNDVEVQANDTIITNVIFQNAAYNSLALSTQGGAGSCSAGWCTNIGGNQFLGGLGAGIHVGTGQNHIIWSNTFYNYVGAGVSVAGNPSPAMTGVQIGGQGTGNAFHHNHWAQPDCSGGGQIYLGNGSNGTQILGNIIAGDYNFTYDQSTASQGIELDPGAENVVISYNNVYNHSGDGENIKWNSHVQISNEQISYNWGYGVSVFGYNGYCSPGPNCADPVVALNTVASSQNCNSSYPLPNHCGFLGSSNLTGNGTDLLLLSVQTANSACSSGYLNVDFAGTPPSPTTAYENLGVCPAPAQQ
jgi:hypothetical protein